MGLSRPSIVEVARRFVGPPDAVNGGYACGLAAQALTGGAQVTLRAPTPVDRPLRLASTERGVGLFDGEQLLVEAVEAEVELGGRPEPIAFEAADAAVHRFDLAAYRSWHPYPGCFGCGPDRGAGDGLRIFPAPAGPGTVAGPWVPDASLAADDGLVAPVFVWTALDCPGGLSWLADAPHEPLVLGRMAAVVHRRPSPGERLVAGGWTAGHDGRKRLCGSAIWGEGGEVLAQAQATWLALRDDQRSSFRAASPSA